MQAQTPPQGLGDTHPGEANAADSPTQHVCKHGWVRASRGEVSEEIGAVPVCYLWGGGTVTLGQRSQASPEPGHAHRRQLGQSLSNVNVPHFPASPPHHGSGQTPCFAFDYFC